MKKKRCEWCVGSVLEMEYHDTEWGVPLHDDRTHFEYIILDGAQAGLSWATILKRRDGYREAFARFDPEKVARFTERKIESLLGNRAIIRNRLKVRSAVKNARAFLDIQTMFGSFDAYIWRFTGGKTIRNRWKEQADIPVSTTESEAMSRDMKKRGFSFVGSTICYAYMQAAGMVNDHTVDCFRYEQVRCAKRCAPE